VTVVVDTNVIAYYLLGTEPFQEETSVFWRGVEHAVAPSSWQAELVNVVWLACRHGALDAVEAPAKLQLAARLGVESVASDTLWHGALARAIANDQPAYDTLFVELAVRQRTALATFDQALLLKFPEVARRPGDVT
jgi:predicted nucleic acid-binding protein